MGSETRHLVCINEIPRTCNLAMLTHIHQAKEDEQRKYYERDVVGLRHIIRVVRRDQGLQHVGRCVRHARKNRDPPEPGDPALHPGYEAALVFGCESVGPVLEGPISMTS